MKKAFTLAEVLITLAIIGVVAALTIPTVVQKHQERVTVNKVKKFYSVMSQALLMSIKDNGTLDEWNMSPASEYSINKENTEVFMSYIKPYLKITKDCGTETGCLGQDYSVKILTGAQHSTNYENDNRYYKFIMNDGSYGWLRPSWATSYCGETASGLQNICGVLFIDINGKNPPNTIGRDIFTFNFLKDRIALGLSDDCKKTLAGWDCSQYIMQNNSMDYLHK